MRVALDLRVDDCLKFLLEEEGVVITDFLYHQWPHYDASINLKFLILQDSKKLMLRDRLFELEEITSSVLVRRDESFDLMCRTIVNVEYRVINKNFFAKLEDLHRKVATRKFIEELESTLAEG